MTNKTYASKATAKRGAKRAYGDNFEAIVTVSQDAETGRWELMPVEPTIKTIAETVVEKKHDLTTIEYRVMDAIAHHEYTVLNGATPDKFEDVQTWCFAEDFAVAAKITVDQCKGVLDSLSKKGYIIIENVSAEHKKRGDDDTIQFTPKGFDVWAVGIIKENVKPAKAKAEKVTEEAPIVEEAKAAPAIKRKSEIGSPCLIVWNMADEMKGARRKDIIQACVDAGVAFYTARTQYQLWYKANKA